MKVQRQTWACHAWLAPFAELVPIISLGPVSSSFLLNKRKLRLQNSLGALFVVDVNPTSARSRLILRKQRKVTQKSTGCKNVARYERLARACVRLLGMEHALASSNKCLKRISCGQLRAAIRACYPDSIPVELELSIKTSQKLETSVCENCESKFSEKLSEWKEARLRPVDVSSQHLDRFEAAAAMNVEEGWNLRPHAYVPNGHACLGISRCQGGNWNEQEFSDECDAELVVSSGKPRVVTLYSSRNTEVLTPLHYSLFEGLQRKGWLLVGSPTGEKVRWLNGAGPFQSVDYQAATDNIKMAYVRRLIHVLERKGVSLTEEEVKCLRVLGQLKIDGVSAQTGQPMGSVMSFPMLCLINKTIVDLALADLLSEGKISRKQFVEHRCLINGDDLLYREFGNSPDIFNGILRHGALVGLRTNTDKTLTSMEEAEINSTLFRHGRKIKKTNLSALSMGRDVNDVLGYAFESTRTLRGFTTLVTRARHILRDQRHKILGPLPRHVIASLRNFKDELTYVPSVRAQPTNAFPVVPMPDGYDLSREESVAIIRRKVLRLREEGYVGPSPVPRVRPTCEGRLPTWRACLKNGRPRDKDTVLFILRSAWEDKQREKLKNEDPDYLIYSQIVGDGSRISQLIDAARAFKVQRKSIRCPTEDAGSWSADFVPFG